MQTITLPAVSIPSQTVTTPLGLLRYPGLDVPERMLLVDPTEIKKLIEAARDAADMAYSAYKVQFPVGAALIMADDPEQQIFAAANNENSVLNAGICAERAVINYVTGQGFRRIKTIVISTAHREKADITLRAPCGLCRQTISEFADDNTVIIVDHDSAGVLGDVLDIHRLLPYRYHYIEADH